MTARWTCFGCGHECTVDVEPGQETVRCYECGHVSEEWMVAEEVILNVHQELPEQDCPVCDRLMDIMKRVWMTPSGVVCSQVCAEIVTERARKEL